jgi:ketosteroid isomerase-like protein
MEDDEMTSASTPLALGVTSTPIEASTTPIEATTTSIEASTLSKEDTVTRLFEAFSERKLTDALALLHPEVVFQPMTAEITRAGEPYRGHEGIRRYVADLEAQWEQLTLHPAQIRAAGQAVVVLGLVSGSGHAGAFEDAPTTWMFKFRDGLVIQAQIFSDARYVHEALVGDTPEPS